MTDRKLGNSLDKLRHPRSVAYSAEQVLLSNRSGVAELLWTVTANCIVCNEIQCFRQPVNLCKADVRRVIKLVRYCRTIFV